MPSRSIDVAHFRDHGCGRIESCYGRTEIVTKMPLVGVAFETITVLRGRIQRRWGYCVCVGYRISMLPEYEAIGQPVLMSQLVQATGGRARDAIEVGLGDFRFLQEPFAERRDMGSAFMAFGADDVVGDV